MHSLSFVWHIAILDPITGLGVLILPDQMDEDDLANSLSCRLTVEPGSRFLGQVGEEYAVIMRQLGSIGWELPRDGHGMQDWFVAGKTDCCGRTMIRLHGLDRIDPDPSLSDLAEVFRQLEDLAAWACCLAIQAEDPIQR